MKNKPLVVCSLPGTPFLTALRAMDPQSLDFTTVAKARSWFARDPRVVYMRTGYEVELRSPILASAVWTQNVFRGLGARIVNPVDRVMLAHRKDLVYAGLGFRGVPVPKCWPSPTLSEIRAGIEAGEWSYPFIWRTVDEAGTKGMHLIQGGADLHEALEALLGKRAMLAEFIDSRNGGETYFRQRAYVIGDRLDMFTVAEQAGSPWIRHESGEHMPAKCPPLVARTAVAAVRILGLHVAAVDLVTPRDGMPRVVDVNPTYNFTPEPIVAPPPILKARRGHLGRLADYLRSLA